MKIKEFAKLEISCSRGLGSAIWEPLGPPLGDLWPSRGPPRRSKSAPERPQERPRTLPRAPQKPLEAPGSPPLADQAFLIAPTRLQEASKTPPGPPWGPLGPPRGSSRSPPGRQKGTPGHLEETSQRHLHPSRPRSKISACASRRSSAKGPQSITPGPAECAKRLNPPPTSGGAWACRTLPQTQA